MFNMDLVSRPGPKIDNSHHRRRLRIVRRLMWSQHVRTRRLHRRGPGHVACAQTDRYRPPICADPKAPTSRFPPFPKRSRREPREAKASHTTRCRLLFLEAPAEASHSLKPSPANPARWKERDMHTVGYLGPGALECMCLYCGQVPARPTSMFHHPACVQSGPISMFSWLGSPLPGDLDPISHLPGHGFCPLSHLTCACSCGGCIRTASHTPTMQPRTDRRIGLSGATRRQSVCSTYQYHVPVPRTRTEGAEAKSTGHRAQGTGMPGRITRTAQHR